MTIFIGSHNVHKLSKVQSAASYGNREDVVILWDELNKKEQSIASNINIDVEVQTSEPSSVPDKWKDSIVEVEGSIDHLDIVKNLIANPSRLDVYDMMLEENPPQPLILWWVEHVFNDKEYAIKLSDICHYSLFKTDVEHLWGTVVFGIEAGKGKFSWPDSSSSMAKGERQEFEEVLEAIDVPEKELELAWDDVKNEAANWLNDPEPDSEEVEEEVSDRAHGSQSSLLNI